MTHGAVSRQIKSLELQLGAKLLSGKKHNLVMTPAGRELAAGLKGAFAMIEAALPGADRGGSLVVSCPATFAMKWLIPRLPNFAALHPEVSVRLVEPSGPIDFSGGEYQCAIVLSEERPPPGQQAKSFLTHAYGPVVSPRLYEAVNEDRRRLLELPRLHSETFPEGWRKWCADAGVAMPAATADRTFEHNSYMLEAVAAGLGVAITAQAFAEHDIEAGRLIAPWGFQPLPGRFRFVRPSSRANPAADAFETWLQRGA